MNELKDAQISMIHIVLAFIVFLIVIGISFQVISTYPARLSKQEIHDAIRDGVRDGIVEGRRITDAKETSK